MNTRTHRTSFLLVAALAGALGSLPAAAGLKIRGYVGYGVYPPGAGDVTQTAPGSGLLANNGSGRALLQLIYAGADGVVGDGVQAVDLDNAANGCTAGDDVVWQSTVLEWGRDDVDEWGFTSALPDAYTNDSWTTSGYAYVRVFQDESPDCGDGYFDTPLAALQTTMSRIDPFGQSIVVGDSAAGVALDRRISIAANFVRAIGADQGDLLTMPLTAGIGNRFGSIETNAPMQTTVYFYDAATTNFEVGIKGVKGWSTPQSNRVVLPGESFFLKSPTGGSFAVSVDGTSLCTPVTNQVNERWTALGYPFPDDVAWTDTALASNLATGSLVYFWDLNEQQYQTYRKGPPARGGWGSASNHVIHPGDGFIVRQPPGSAPFLWIQERGE